MSTVDVIYIVWIKKITSSIYFIIPTTATCRCRACRLTAPLCTRTIVQTTVRKTQRIKKPLKTRGKIFLINKDYFFLTPSTIFTRERTKANTAVPRNPPVVNPGTIEEANWIIKTEIINETSPNVIQLSGKVSKRRILPINALTKQITTPATIAVHNDSTSTPGTSQAAIEIAIPLRISFRINFIIILLYISI